MEKRDDLNFDVSQLGQRINDLLGAKTAARIQVIGTTDGKYVSIRDLCEWASRMDEASISDQKQEVFRGLRMYLHFLESVSRK